MIGQKLGHFRIVEKIGAGGMGVVYRAHDEQLDRDVAIKVLPAGTLNDETTRKRFRQEALTLSKLNHPNIGTLHEFDTDGDVDYLVMEYVAGITLSEKLASGPLVEKEILHLGQHLAEGLAAAHERSVVHRDLKPGNLRVTPDGRLKILDFGLAKLLAPGSDLAVTEAATEPRAAPGTLPYMAPEQVRGEGADLRSDLYAAGAVLYEMATGQRLFPRETEAVRLLHAILYEAPRPPSAVNPRVTAGLESIILKCLEKDPEHRYQSAKELLADLRRASAGSTVVVDRRRAFGAPSWILGTLALIIVLAVAIALVPGPWRERWMGGQTAPIRSLAVLPLQNISGDPEQDYFADGMTDALITDLGQIGALRVVSKTSVMQYKRAAKPLSQIAQELNLDAALEGAVQRSGSRVQIRLRLVQARTDTQIWGESYDRDLRDTLELQSEVARIVADKVRVQLTREEHARISAAPQIRPEALDAYLRGRQLWERRTEGSLKRSLEYFQEAVALEPKYALAYVGIADTYAVLGDNQFLSPAEAFPRAKAAAQKAREMDEGLAEAHASLGFLLSRYDLNWEAAGREFRRALELNPNYATAYHWYAAYLSCVGRHDEALAAMRKAQELDPYSSRINANVGFILFLARRYDEALAALHSALEKDPGNEAAQDYQALIYTEKGEHQQALAILQEEVQKNGHSAQADLDMAYALARAGDRKQSAELLARAMSEASKAYVPRYAVARVYAALGQNGSALAYLKKAFDEHASQVAFLRVDPRLDPLRSDPGFQELLRRANLAQAQ